MYQCFCNHILEVDMMGTGLGVGELSGWSLKTKSVLEELFVCIIVG